MKKSLHFLAFLSLILGLLFTSCVSSKKFNASEAQVDKLQKDIASTNNQLDDCNSQVDNLSKDKASLQSKNTLAQNDLQTLADESNLTIAEQAARLKNFQGLIQLQKDVMSDLKNSIANALMNYKADELYVYINDGKVYVSLEEKLLFKSGSDVVNPKGKEVLKMLAQVLNNTRDIAVVIEGHTDSIPIQTAKFKDNWDLSTARATSIVRILTIDNGFDSNLITASGKSQFHPVKSNETADGRAGNRRTEIILSPNLKDLYDLLYQ